MLEKEITLKNETGLHARPAARFAKLANTFSSDIKISYQGKTYNGKSIMRIMTLGIPCGARFTLQVEGQDEEEALNQLEELLLHGLE
ncbi:HPr family phosphocarrier protein [Iocasia frigidifontis]|uniref:Phosphocarrier protein HPr n=1 Tax=Iocasia fonsfrigidae TaxID=2682810 RepID=A0A8A7KE82_9FIRM|nr:MULTISPECIES: HPr family phosphocarrier protein [Halanaerobiaceae]AZO93311.1 HPr family phosphocarrier protein [Halocella sp. SP3-1]QTL99570.1 HPr family phosphocarrier protein [Iocasia fonsfrigidae]